MADVAASISFRSLPDLREHQRLYRQIVGQWATDGSTIQKKQIPAIGTDPLFRGRRVHRLVLDSSLYYLINPRYVADIVERIRVEDNEIGKLASFDSAQVAFFTNHARRVNRCG